jgi:hypothetical protein
VDKSDFPDASTGHYRASQGHSRMPDVSWEIAFNPRNPGSESNFPDITLDPPYKQGLVAVVMGLLPCGLLAIPVGHSPTVPHLLLCMGFVPLSPHHSLMSHH